jgi:SNF2 family DNA or RNA helicase
LSFRLADGDSNPLSLPAVSLRFVKKGKNPAGPRWLSIRGTSDDTSAAEVRELVSRSAVSALLDVPGVWYRDEPLQGTNYSQVSFDVPLNVLYARLPGAAEVQRFVFGARDYADEARLVDGRWVKACVDVIDRGELLGSLRPYQETALRWLIKSPTALLGDDMGLGKTLTTIRAAELVCEATKHPAGFGSWWARQTPHVIILGPKTLRGEWKAQLRQWSTDPATRAGDTFFACEGVKPEPEKIGAHHRWVYCHYDILHAWVHRLIPLHPVVVIADESHALKGRATKRRQAGELAFGMGMFGWQLTGTPILNRLRELHALFDVLDRHSFGGENAFRRRYMGAQEGAYGLEDGDFTHGAELQARVSTCYLARKKRDVGLQLPPLTRALREVELEDKDYEDLENTLSGLPPKALFDALLRGAGGKDTIRLITRARQLLARGKAPASIAAAQDALEGGESVVVFSSFRATANRIAKALEKTHETSFVTGELTQAQREKQIDRFRAEGDAPRALVATYATLAVGVNLQRASVGIFNDLTWTPAELLQAEARFYRGGQTRPCMSIWPIVRRTLDDFLVSCLSRKANLIQDALGDSDAATLLDFMGPDRERELRDMFDAWCARRAALSHPSTTSTACP